MQAEIIAIGDEILIGQTIDTNAAFIARQLNAIGVVVKQKRAVADASEAITDALDEIHPGTRLVFLTGGLGPTNDDITKKTLLHYFGGELHFHEEIYQHIVQLFASFGRQPREVHRLQACLPSSCRPVINHLGTASGMHFQREGKHYFSLPGVPYETQHLVQDSIIPWIATNLPGGTVVHRTLLTQGLPESDLAARLKEFEDNLPSAVKIAYLPSPGIVKIRLSCYTGSRQEAEAKVARLAERLRELLGETIFGQNAESLQEVVGIALRERGLSLCTAESCTGGKIAAMITGIAGSSDYFRGSVVSYASRAKSELLDVDPDLIVREGVVSEAVARAMATAAREKFHTDFALSTTGIAGPAGGSEQAPVGTIWIGLASPSGVWARQYRFGTNRERNISKACLTALNLLRHEVLKIAIGH